MAHVQNRPLSPHLQIWRWHVTMLASIGHRASGVAMYAGVVGLGLWLAATALGGEAIATINALLASPIGRIGVYVLIAAFGYHLCNGLRHLFWDVGKGFTPAIANLSAWIALAVGVIGTPIAVYLLRHLAG